MSIIAKKEEGLKIEALEAGVYMGTCKAIIDLGMQFNEKFNKTAQKIMVMWSIIGEKVLIGEEEKERTISKEYTLSLGEKANLTKDLEAWRGKKFTPEELMGFDLVNILNKSCQLNIIKDERNGKEYNNINAIMALAKGQKAEPLADVMIFDLTDAATWEHWKNIPSWMQEKIQKAENYAISGLKAYVEDNADENAIKASQTTEDFITIDTDEEELPF